MNDEQRLRLVRTTISHLLEGVITAKGEPDDAANAAATVFAALALGRKWTPADAARVVQVMMAAIEKAEGYGTKSN